MGELMKHRPHMTGHRSQRDDPAAGAATDSGRRPRIKGAVKATGSGPAT